MLQVADATAALVRDLRRRGPPDLTRKLAGTTLQTYQMVHADLRYHGPELERVFFEEIRLRAESHFELEQLSPSISRFKEKFPKSPYLADAFLVLADFHYQQGDLALASTYAMTSLTIPNGRCRSYGRYLEGKLERRSGNRIGGRQMLEDLLREKPAPAKILVEMARRVLAACR